MENKGITLRGRILQLIVEIIIGIILIMILSVLAIYFLYSNRIINSVSIKDELDYDFIKNEKNITNYLDAFKVDYIVFDKLGQIEQKSISDSNLILAKESFSNKKVLNTSSGEFLFFKKIDGFVIIRIPYIPEFTDFKLRDKHNFNFIFNNTVITLCLVMSFIPIVRLLTQIKKEFLVLEKIILCDIENVIPKDNSVKIIEIQKSINQVNIMKKILTDLAKNEKTQKKDLIFQTSALSHDIKTPLTIIKGNAGLLEYCDSREEMEECIKFINSSVETIESYLDQIISYAKISYYQKEKKDVELGCLVSDILKNIDGYKNDIEFELKCDFENKNEKIFCSKANIERAVINILINAFQYAKSRVILSVACNEKLTFRIYNDGENVSEETLKNMGKLFFTDDKRRNNNGKHYGIGLYFTKKTAVDHGGDLKCNNFAVGVEFVLEIQK